MRSASSSSSHGKPSSSSWNRFSSRVVVHVDTMWRRHMMRYLLVALLIALLLVSVVRRQPIRTQFVLQHDSSSTALLRLRDDMQSDYEMRLSAATRRGRAAPMRRYLRWLHVPKTGTSLVNTLIRWGCVDLPSHIFVMPRKERPSDLTLSHEQTFSWDWLFSNRSGRTWLRTHCADRLVTTNPTTKKPDYSLNIHKPLSKWELSHAVVMFRIPKQRAYSNYLHLNLHYNRSKTVKEPLYSFLHHAEFWSQHTKLLLGRGYRDTRLITEEEARVAIQLVESHLPFVGLTEQFRLSCRLFHAKFGGVPHLVQFENVRPSLDRYAQPQSRNESFRYDETQFRDWVDSADEMVYAAAQRRFWDDVARYKTEIEKDGLGAVHVLPPSERYQTHVLHGAPGTFRHIAPYKA